ncbi:unnamed protein product, partial [Discosporangium mesarthrocarpum]
DFANRRKLQLASLDPKPKVLDILKEQKARVCPLSCGVRFRAVGGRCVLKTCPKGKGLSRKGTCVTLAKVQPKRKLRKNQKPKSKATTRRKPNTKRRAPNG